MSYYTFYKRFNKAETVIMEYEFQCNPRIVDVRIRVC